MKGEAMCRGENWLLRCAALALVVVLAGCDRMVSNEARLTRAAELSAHGSFNEASIELRKVVEHDSANARAWFLLGEASLQINQPASAEGQLRRALELGIDKAEVVVPLGKALLGQAKFRRALEELERAEVRDRATQAQVLQLRGDAYAGIGHNADAERAYIEALSADAGSLDARLGLARVQQHNGNAALAEQQITDVLERDRGYVPGWLARGLLDLQLHRYQAAEAAFGQAFSEAKASAAQKFAALHGVAESQWRQGRTGEAVRTVERLLALAPRHAQAMYLRAAIAYSSGDYATAKEYLEKTVQVDPRHQPANLLLGATHFAMGELEQANMYLNSALTGDPSSAATRKLLAATQMRQRRPREAVAALAPIVEETDDVSVLRLMGEASLQAGERSSGVMYFERAHAASPADRGLELQLANAYVTVGNFDRAVDLLIAMPEAGAVTAGRDPLLVLAYMRKGEAGKALKHAQDLAARNRGDAGAQSLLGSVYMTLKQWEKAQAQFDKALDLQPDNPVVLANLARLAMLQDRADQARARFERVVALRPDNWEAMLALAQLSARSDDKQAVERWLVRAHEAEPQAMQPALLLIRYFLATDQRDKARNVARQLVSARPADADAHNALGIVFSADGASEQAVVSFRKAVTIAVDSANFTYNLARAELAIQRRAEAKRLIRRALALEPGHRGALATLAALEMQDGETAQALERVRVLKQDQRSAAAGLVLEGDLYMLKRDFSAAADVYEEAQRRNPSRLLAVRSYEARKRAGVPDPVRPLDEWLLKHPGDAGARLVRALDYQRRGSLAQAAVEYEKILASKPDDVLALNNLAWVYAGLRDSRALSMAERAHVLDPANGAITDTLGWILVQKGEVERGKALLEKAVAQAPELPDVRYHLAVAQARAGAKEDARRTLTALLSAGHDFDEKASAKLLLESL
jgi:putative PEP-CTERM system TPR-repeat lipoprotein